MTSSASLLRLFKLDVQHLSLTLKISHSASTSFKNLHQQQRSLQLFSAYSSSITPAVLFTNTPLSISFSLTVTTANGVLCSLFTLDFLSDAVHPSTFVFLCPSLFVSQLTTAMASSATLLRLFTLDFLSDVVSSVFAPPGTM